MSAASATLAGRAAAEAQMIDTCTVTRVTGETTDPLTGASTPTYSAPVYADRCKVQTFLPQEQNPEAGGVTFTVQRSFIHFPVAKTATGYEPSVGDVVTIATSQLDPHMVGRQYRVVAPHFETAGTAYRVAVEETT